MAELFLDLRRGPKERAYGMLHAAIASTLAGITDSVAGMATIASLTHNAFGFLWTGFYRVVDGRLLVGPYQGTLGCLEIEIGRGVCGTAAKERRSVIVTDASRFPGHIARGALRDAIFPAVPSCSAACTAPVIPIGSHARLPLRRSPTTGGGTRVPAS